MAAKTSNFLHKEPRFIHSLGKPQSNNYVLARILLQQVTEHIKYHPAPYKHQEQSNMCWKRVTSRLVLPSMANPDFLAETGIKTEEFTAHFRVKCL